MKQEERLLKKGREEQEERLLKRGRGDGIVQDFNKTCTFFCICRKIAVSLHAKCVQKEKIEHALSIDTENENYLVGPYEEIPNKRKPVIGR